MTRKVAGELSEQGKRACQLYMSMGNQGAAYKAAGYKARYHGQAACNFFNSPPAKAYIAELSSQILAKNMLSAERVLEEFARIAFADLTQYYKYSKSKGKWVLKSLDELTPDQRAAISKYKPGQYVELHSKDSALDKLGKHFKLYTDIDASINNLVIMPELKINGQTVVFEVGKPAPPITASGKKQR